VLSNATLGTLIATINSSILLISLPAIFRGIGINPLAPGESGYLLWILMGYMVVSACCSSWASGWACSRPPTRQA